MKKIKKLLGHALHCMIFVFSLIFVNDFLILPYFQMFGYDVGCFDVPKEVYKLMEIILAIYVGTNGVGRLILGGAKLPGADEK